MLQRKLYTNSPATIPLSEQEICTPLINLRSILRYKAILPVKIAEQSKHQRIRPNIRHEAALGNKGVCETLGFFHHRAARVSEPLFSIFLHLLFAEWAKAIVCESRPVKRRLLVPNLSRSNQQWCNRVLRRKMLYN